MTFFRGCPRQRPICRRVPTWSSRIFSGAPISLAGRILGNRRVIAERNPFRRHRFESLTLREYFDFSVREKGILEGRYLHG